MAVLHNDAKTLRFVLELVDRETLPVVPGQPPPAVESLRVLGSSGVEYMDRRDQAYWPFLRVPVLYLAGGDASTLVGAIRSLCALERPGFGFRTGAQDELALQVARQEGGGFVVEVGIDLAVYLFETSGLQGDPGRELALFRFTTSTSELVIFADQIKRELAELPGAPLAADSVAPRQDPA
jgi:hypothetical protein